MPTQSSPSQTRRVKKRPDIRAPFSRWVWASAGATIGLIDFGVLLVFDANLTIAGRDFTFPMFLFFLIPYAALGWAIGGLSVARVRADRNRETIQNQLAALEQTQRALVQEEKLAGIGRLAAGVAHEVRNPLSVIRASASMVQESFDPNTDPYRALGFICEETDRLERLIQALLTFAKPQPIDLVSTELPKVIDRALELARPEAREAGVDLDVEVAAGLPTLCADPDRLSQAIYGLTLNAIQAIAHDLRLDESRTRRVSIRGRERDGRIEIDVVDSGPGVPDELRDQIFEPFVTTKDTGTGLGLPMAVGLVEAQGGTLRLAEFADQPLSGACFRIEFPIQSAHEGAVS